MIQPAMFVFTPILVWLFGNRELKHTNGYLLPGFIVLLLLISRIAQAAEDAVVQVTIADPFIELHTGPGSGYPIFHIVDRGNQVSIIKQRTNWIQIRATNGETGWASRDQMLETLLPSGDNLTITEASQSDFSSRKWLLGVMGGAFGNAPTISIFTGYSFTKSLSAELSFGNSIGNTSSSSLLKANLLMQPFPELSYSPYFTLGVGDIRVTPSSTLISSNPSNSSVAQVGIGIQHYLNRRFIFRLDYSQYIVFSANNIRDKNEEINEWKAGFAVFF
jgi:hypothetical protein